MLNEVVGQFGQNLRDRGLQGLVWSRKVLLFAEIANHIHHTKLPQTLAWLLSFIKLRTCVVAAPHADLSVFRATEGRDGFAHSGGGRQRPKWRLPEAEVGHAMGKETCCHAMRKWERFEKTEESRDFVVLGA